jgi:hypothetical protein
MSSDATGPSETPSIALPDEFYESLAARAAAVGWSYTLSNWGLPGRKEYVAIALNFPSGAGERPVTLPYTARVTKMLNQPFERFRLSANYEALIDTQSGDVEVALSGESRAGRGLSVWELPGVELDEDSPLRSGEAVAPYEVPTGWRLIVAEGDITIELSPQSPMFDATFDRYAEITLKIRHSRGPDGPRADALLDDYAAHFVLELELQHGLGFNVQRRLSDRSGHALVPAKADVSPRFPQHRYSTEAMAFYWYGTAAVGLPLLQYLAFYQVLEFFFSSFTRRSIVERLRSQLKDPRFDLRNDTDIDGLIDASQTAHVGLTRELDQLRHTLSDCVAPGGLRAFLRSDDQLSNHFLAAKSKIRGTSPMRLDADDEDLIRQLADRVYRVRNRIVHTKGAAEEVGIDLLLPASDESNDIWPEVELVRWLAKRALVHGAVPR